MHVLFWLNSLWIGTTFTITFSFAYCLEGYIKASLTVQTVLVYEDDLIIRWQWVVSHLQVINRADVTAASGVRSVSIV